MSTLDPDRYRHVVARDPSHTVPVPGRPRGVFLAAEGERVDIHDPYWIMAINDGSVRLLSDEEVARLESSVSRHSALAD